MDSLNLLPDFSLTIEKAIPAPPAHSTQGCWLSPAHINLLVLPQTLLMDLEKAVQLSLQLLSMMLCF